MLSNFDKHDKTQLLAKFKKFLYVGFRATSNFRKFKVRLNPIYRIFFKLCQKLRLIMLIKSLQTLKLKRSMLTKSLLILLFKGMVKSVKDITRKNHEENKGINSFL